MTHNIHAMVHNLYMYISCSTCARKVAYNKINNFFYNSGHFFCHLNTENRGLIKIHNTRTVHVYTGSDLNR